MKRFICAVIACALALSLWACAETAFEEKTSGICRALVEGDYAAIAARLDENAAAAVDEAVLRQSWEAITDMYGAFVSVNAVRSDEAARAAAFTLGFENGDVLLSVALDSEDRIRALTLSPAAPQTAGVEKALPAGCTETDTVLWPDTERSLSGKLLLPGGYSADTPFVIFVHGSGPCDMDESAGPNRIFRDMAYDLAGLGIGSLRFDKITYAHPEIAAASVVQEYLEPLQEAVRVLKAHTGAARIYVAGHSLGGMLTPWLAEECGLAGGISMAGTPLPLWEISYRQNLALLAYYPEDQQAALMETVDAELEKAMRLREMDEAELANETVFGIGAAYQRVIADLDQRAIARESAKPFLFIWGDADLQVDAEAFAAWQRESGVGDKCAFITYPGLNHMFLPAGPDDNFLNIQQAYMRPANVPVQVSEDIACWIRAQHA